MSDSSVSSMVLERPKKTKWRRAILWLLIIFVMVFVFLQYLHPDFVVNLEALQSFCA